MSRLVSYCRVSSELQRDNTSLEHQRKRIEAYCLAAGHEIVAYFDESETASGKKFRPNFNAALEVVYSDAADGLVCMKLDRFARNTMQGLEVAAELKRRGKQLVIVDLSLDTSTPVGACIFSVLLSFSQLERDTINERTSAGRKAVITAGGYAYGRPPYGWKAKGKRLIPQPEEQEALAQMFAMWNAGRGTWAIAEELNAMGVPSKTGKKWHQRTVHNIITRDHYGLSHVMDGLESVPAKNPMSARFPNYGVPYGWRLEGAELISIPEEQKTRRLIFDLAASGISNSAIAKELNRRGIPYKRERLWRTQAVRTLIERDFSTRAKTDAQP